MIIYNPFRHMLSKKKDPFGVFIIFHHHLVVRDSKYQG